MHHILLTPVNYALLLCFCVAVIPQTNTTNGQFCEKHTCEDNNETKREEQAQVILYWTHFYGHQDFDFGFGRGPFIEAGCPVNNCWATADKSLSHEANAFLFHMRNVEANTPLPVGRTANQSFVFFLMEHPFNQWNDLRQWAGFFNLTMTYRLDSDIQARYGRTVATTENSRDLVRGNRAQVNIQTGKRRKPIAWFVSNCHSHSRREEYVEELQKYIPVDVYGKCGPLKCPNNNTAQDTLMNPSCYRMLEDSYDFYLSFENIHCIDYVTEKLFNVLHLDTVPVVMGAADYLQLTPPHSVINVDRFASPRHLASYLLHLRETPGEYWGYKAWRRTHRVVGAREAYQQAFCDLCELLNKPTHPGKQYDDLHGWWGKDSACDRHVMHGMKKRWH